MFDTLFRGWPATDPRRRVLICNSGHGGLPKFMELASQGLIDVIVAPIWDPAPQLYARRYGPFREFMVRVAYRIALPVLYIWAILYFAMLCRRLNVTGFFSHNGGYPGGHINRAGVLGAWLARVKKRYHVVHSMARRPARLAMPWARVVDFAIENAATETLAVSAASASSLVSERKFSRVVTIVHNGIEVSLDPVPNPVREHAGRPNFQIGFVGRIVPDKGLDVLLNAMARLPIEVTLRIFGEGSAAYVNALRYRAKTLGIESRVNFAGYVSDVPARMRDFDLVAIPSTSFESFPLALLEAMCCRLPLVVTDSGGMKEIVEHGVTGFVVPARDVAALHDAILTLINDRDLAARFGDAGYDRLVAEFTADKMISRYFALVA